MGLTQFSLAHVAVFPFLQVLQQDLDHEGQKDESIEFLFPNICFAQNLDKSCFQDQAVSEAVEVEMKLQPRSLVMLPSVCLSTLCACKCVHCSVCFQGSLTRTVNSTKK